MGQYHLVANLSRKEYLHPHHLGNGFKLMEWGCSGDSTSLALALLLTGPSDHPIIGRWAGDKIVVLGDYFESNDIPGVTLPGDLWETITEEKYRWCDLSLHMYPVFEALGVERPHLWYQLPALTTKIVANGDCVRKRAQGKAIDVAQGAAISDAPLYVCNLTQKQYIDPRTFRQQPHLLGFGRDAEGTTTALACLLAVSNNRGGGDLSVEGEPGSELVGTWGGDSIAITSSLPTGKYTDISAQALQMICIDPYVADTYRTGERSPAAASRPDFVLYFQD